MKIDLKRVLEALLFVAEAPLSPAQLKEVLEMEDQGRIREVLEEMRAEYEGQERAFILVEVAGGYCFRTRPEMAFWLKKLKRQQITRLSRASLETLAIVAYKQPVLKAEVERIRGVEVGGMLKTLMEKGLVRVAGRRDLPGRPLVYATTRRFLEVFDLKSLDELPTLEEIDALAEEPDGVRETPQGEFEFMGPSPARSRWDEYGDEPEPGGGEGEEGWEGKDGGNGGGEAARDSGGDPYGGDDAGPGFVEPDHGLGVENCGADETDGPDPDFELNGDDGPDGGSGPQAA